ncbi:MAG TPA: YqgE/AlgH family protein [Burkholderiales bacterium]|nr:YqgE/AlgH family protein [Burkholderiales bacterium]
MAAVGPALAQDDIPNGVFLVAKRQLNDPNFQESVVLITQHAGGSPVGVIVNRPTKLPLSRLFPDNEKLKDLPDVVHFGGPVSPRVLVFVFRAESPPQDALRVLADVYMSFSSELLSQLLVRPKPTAELRVYAGYSGWAPGQLQHEVARGDWHMVRADADTIFRMDEALVWREMLNRATARQTLRGAPARPLALAR